MRLRWKCANILVGFLFAGLFLSGCWGPCGRPFAFRNLLQEPQPVSITRTAANSFEAGLIAAAEASCPPLDDVYAIYGGTPPVEYEGCLWWYSERENGYRLPYAITADAIAYLEDWTESQFEDSFSTRFFSRYYTFRYNADVRAVTPEDNAPPEALYAVSMRLTVAAQISWTTQERTVFFDATGALLEVRGDGEVQVAVC